MDDDDYRVSVIYSVLSNMRCKKKKRLGLMILRL